ncbi:hypothetical protein [Roseicella aquatilis]|uniref:Peptidase C39-like domain-containing protein n=1 Tax=Roseicella aquatilis TaxID=2527868 RepID=A0A4R4DUR5_9PROT|nr:hypothetical protein [Roseicella aquatilis]TCZ64053.1 hypothetical protein EXY23_08775 [Roseicella aquatilis]
MGLPHPPTNEASRAEAGHRTDRPAALRGHLALLEENQGETPWCGPAALALATGHSYADAGMLLRSIAPAWYPEEGPIVTAYWRDLLGALEAAGIEYAPVALPEKRRSLIRFARDGLEAGWYLLRITDHFLLLRSHGFGLATLHDNRHTGVLVSARTHGRRHVTHAVRLLGGPLAAA